MQEAIAWIENNDKFRSFKKDAKKRVLNFHDIYNVSFKNDRELCEVKVKFSQNEQTFSLHGGNDMHIIALVHGISKVGHMHAHNPQVLFHVFQHSYFKPVELFKNTNVFWHDSWCMNFPKKIVGTLVQHSRLCRGHTYT